MFPLILDNRWNPPVSLQVSEVNGVTRFEDLGLTYVALCSLSLSALLYFLLFSVLHPSCLLSCVGLLAGRGTGEVDLRIALPKILFYPVFAPSLGYDIQM